MATIPEKDMPCPRIELRWMENDGSKPAYPASEYPLVCRYSLVIPLDRLDIRAEGYGDHGETIYGAKRELAVEMGNTFSSGSLERLYDAESDTVREPFRDGAHASWDAPHVGNPPIYAVCLGRAELRPLRPKMLMEDES